MSYIRRLISFLVVLLFIGFGGYFGFLNMDRIYVSVPFVGEFKVVGFLAFLLAFMLGGVFAAVFFGYDFFRKSLEVRRNRRDLQRAQKEPHHRVSRFLEEETQARKEPSI